jgi:hypothetical protein
MLAPLLQKITTPGGWTAPEAVTVAVKATACPWPTVLADAARTRVVDPHCDAETAWGDRIG